MTLSATGERQRNMKGGGGRREAGPERKGRQEEDQECREGQRWGWRRPREPLPREPPPQPERRRRRRC